MPMPPAPDYLELDRPRPMTPEQFAARMREFARHDDLEARHGNADLLMCRVLRTLGYGEGIEVYVEMGKWYA